MSTVCELYPNKADFLKMVGSTRGQENFSAKNQTVNISDLVSHSLSYNYSTLLFCESSQGQEVNE